MIHAPPRATTKSGTRQRHFTRSHAPTQLSHTVNALTRATRAYDVIITRLSIFDPNRPGPNRKFDPDRTGLNSKKKKFQKFKNFKMDLSHSIFRVHSDFGTHFFIRGSKIVQKSSFQKSWLLCKCWPNVKIFKIDLSHSIFRVHSDFGVHFIIWDSKIVQMAQIPRQLTLILKST